MENIGNMKKIVFVVGFILVLLISFLGITYSFEFSSDDTLTFELNGDSIIEIGLNSKYVEYGVKVIKNNRDISDSVIIDSSMVNVNAVGEYKVKYEIDNNGNKEYIYRIVKVINKDIPVIKIKGEEIVYLILNGSYYEEGYVVTDNKDKDINDRVEIIGNVDSSKVGEYKLEYKVVDSDLNETSVYRTVIVMEPKVTLADMSGNRVIYSANDATLYENTVISNKWMDKSIYIEGYVRNKYDDYKIKLKNRDNGLEYLYEVTEYNGNYYKVKIDLSLVPNGEFDLYIVSNNSEDRLLNKLSGFSRLLRSKVGSRLVTFMYDENDSVGLKIEPFKYEYDIVIDPGHGSSDVGASNGIMYEKDMNLIQSMYEKCRYESMGLKVFMTRYDDSYGTLMGPNDLDNLQRRSLTVGYYGAVSRVTYSNHHNASIYSEDSGFEILVSNDLTIDELEIERNLYRKYSLYYGIDDNKTRIYSRDYDSGRVYNKISGTIYDYMDYYAMIRIPRQLFNVKAIIFEPMYVSNSSDFSWYWTNKKWIDVSEIKIEEYVNYVGKIYNPDNSMCL